MPTGPSTTGFLQAGQAPGKKPLGTKPPLTTLARGTHPPQKSFPHVLHKAEAHPKPHSVLGSEDTEDRGTLPSLHSPCVVERQKRVTMTLLKWSVHKFLPSWCSRVILKYVSPPP